MKDVTLKINDFEGPLDLLLHLIMKNKMDIADIDISNIVEHYISIINENRQFNIEIASEFIEMASRLLYLKSIILLPKKQEIEKLKKELVGQLIEYQLCKEIASILKSQDSGFNKLIRESIDIKVDATYDQKHNAMELLSAYYAMLDTVKRKMPPRIQEFDTFVQKSYISVETRVIYVLNKIRKRGNIDLFDILNSDDKSTNVATFLAILELIKSKKIVIDGECRYIALKESV